MANPKKRHTSSRTQMRRHANWKLRDFQFSRCVRCSNPILSHHLCKKCGFYKDRLIISGAVSVVDTEQKDPN